MIPENKIEEVRLSLDQSSTAAILEYIGYEVYRGYKFKLREERTPSASIRKDGYIFDFGGDFRGDMIALLQEYHEMNFPQAVGYVAECLGIDL